MDSNAFVFCKCLVNCMQRQEKKMPPPERGLAKIQLQKDQAASGDHNVDDIRHAGKHLISSKKSTS